MNIHQLLANSGYPQNVTESIINVLISKHLHPCGIIIRTRESFLNIDNYFNLQNLSTLKIYTIQIKTIINDYRISLGKGISVKTYFKPL